MIVQRTFLGPGRKWVGPWRVRVNTEASGTSKLTVHSCLYGINKKLLLFDWGDGTQTISAGTYVTHTYAEPGDYIVSHYARGNWDDVKLYCESSESLVEVLDAFPRLPAVGDRFNRVFNSTKYLQTIPVDLFDNNADYITSLNGAFYSITGGPLHIPAGLCSHLYKLTNVANMFGGGSTIDYIPDGLFENMKTLTTAASVFSNVNAAYAGSRIFAGCTGLTDIYSAFYAAHMDSLGDDTFNGCTSLDGEMSDALSVLYCKSVGARTYANCPSVTSCGHDFSAVPNLESLGDYTWQNCTGLVKGYEFLKSAPKLKTLPSHTFSNCPNFIMNGYMFYDQYHGTPVLGAFDLYLDNCPTMYNEFAYVPDMTSTTRRIIHVPAGCTAKSKFPTKYTIVADR